MILFILEGNKPDRSLYQAMMKICGVDEETVAVVYGCNNSYCVSRQECRNFKQLASEFSYYPNIDFLTRVGDLELKQNWEQLKIQNVSKANYICNGSNVYPPLNRESISQKQILINQINKFESQPDCRVSVLSSFPLLMYDWLGR